MVRLIIILFSVGLTCSQGALSSREIALITATVLLSVLVVGLAVTVVILGLRLTKKNSEFESQENALCPLWYCISCVITLVLDSLGPKPSLNGRGSGNFPIVHLCSVYSFSSGYEITNTLGGWLLHAHQMYARARHSLLN